MSNLGIKLHQLRQSHNLTSRQLGDILGVSHGHLLRIEKGEKRPSIDLVARIATYFEVSTGQLIFDHLELDG
ncbi:helix-turn-helix transcriptional regulator [Anaerolineales bacterium HSG24]|nr:helix-turn-helix transcriptional regulator [Anaerolineales bacterium HSG24]